jgi:hypothetical protein
LRRRERAAITDFPPEISGGTAVMRNLVIMVIMRIENEFSNFSFAVKIKNGDTAAHDDDEWRLFGQFRF